MLPQLKSVKLDSSSFHDFAIKRKNRVLQRESNFHFHSSNQSAKGLSEEIEMDNVT